MATTTDSAFRYQEPPTQALTLDKANGDDFWKRSIATEINQNLHKFREFCVLDDDKLPPSLLLPHTLPYDFFAVKVYLWQKSRLVIDGNHSSHISKEGCFAPTVSLDSVRLGFLLAQIRSLDCVAANISNAYLTSFILEWLYIVNKAIYGTRTGGACFHKSLSIKLWHFYFKPFFLFQIYECRRVKGEDMEDTSHNFLMTSSHLVQHHRKYSITWRNSTCWKVLDTHNSIFALMLFNCQQFFVCEIQKCFWDKKIYDIQAY